MSQKKKYKPSYFSLSLLALLFFLNGCKDDPECRRNTDCDVVAGEICQKGKCRENTIISTDSGRDTGTASVADSETANGPDTQTHTQLDTTVDSATTVPDTDDDDPVCVSNADCINDNPCMSGFCNTQLTPAQCEYNPEADGVRCGDQSDPCAANATCMAGECVGSAVCESSTPPGGCISYEGVCTVTDAGAPSCSYTEVPVADNTACYLGSPCQQGVCLSGECVDTVNPCDAAYLHNPCTAASCQPAGNGIGDFDCQISTADDGQFCQLRGAESACYVTPEYSNGVPGYCMFNGETSDCIINEERPCYDVNAASICAAQECVFEDGSCVAIPEADVSIPVSCGETVTLTPSDFVTRDYYSYGGACGPMDVRGKEVALTLDISAPANVTVTAVDEGGQDFKLYVLSDMCDPNSCLKNARDTLSLLNMAPTDVIIVEAGIGNPPESSQIRIICD